ncbi:phosphoribosylformylglycinamidine synthase, PurQ domain protein [Citrifermentans bemidjiense Bem]|uniref:Phosphoribosylformylglycinamidine synthase, PurQ domain protein n=1 Tax=Citrifermentans bemidjiense (strain ATCC BAA-1014 / DSM 16622 / JCM 12645 / Bem) TaxID=404380 RepID=B5EF33_CITBB|nr:phosphoribosylformylglycinamidine synthase subunit PurQ [Citrifermentans bemidjiense]ACH39342.1 phosphoribosylformylglycinamidine synthase, PurQ domain protein [Citrifermentans bemidjiense Bem]
MTKAKALVITGNGTNCEMEAAHACRLGGFDEARIAHISELMSGEVSLDDYHFLNLTGGFLDGDDLGSAKAQANRLRYAAVEGKGELLVDQISRFIADGKLILGVCNGFQLLVKMGMLPALGGNYLNQTATLTYNANGRFQDRWCYLKCDAASPSLYTRGIEGGVYLPVRHGEGKFLVDDANTLEAIETKHLTCLKYSDKHYAAPTMEFPENPNGSVNAIAGICDETGRVMGLMPHPEAFVHRTQHPRWTREDLPEEGEGLIFFKNAAKYVKENF